jgi:hypothetical protein
MLLMVLTGELSCEAKEARSVLLAREDVEDDDMDRRNEVRMLCGEKRAVMDWKRGVCMMAVGMAVGMKMFRVGDVESLVRLLKQSGGKQGTACVV